jgi:hypothetical protein
VDAATVKGDARAALRVRRSDPAFAHAIYHDDAVLEFPQSGERFVGIENFREWRGEYLVDGEARRGAGELALGGEGAPEWTNGTN